MLCRLTFCAAFILQVGVQMAEGQHTHEPLKIMALGDSFTHGRSREVSNGYDYGLESARTLGGTVVSDFSKDEDLDNDGIDDDGPENSGYGRATYRALLRDYFEGPVGTPYTSKLGVSCGSIAPIPNDTTASNSTDPNPVGFPGEVPSEDLNLWHSSWRGIRATNLRQQSGQVGAWTMPAYTDPVLGPGTPVVPDFVFMQCGHNDLSLDAASGGVLNLAERNQLRQQYSSILSMIQASFGAHTVLGTLTPVHPNAPFAAQRNSAISIDAPGDASINKVIRDLNSQSDVTIVDFAPSTAPVGTGLIEIDFVVVDTGTGRDSQDWGHPNDFGNLKLARGFLMGMMSHLTGGFVDVNNNGTFETSIDEWNGEAYGIIPGDLHLDGAVNFTDYLTLSSNYGLTSTSFSYVSYSQGDIDGDGEVGFNDFLILNTYYGGSF